MAALELGGAGAIARMRLDSPSIGSAHAGRRGASARPDWPAPADPERARIARLLHRSYFGLSATAAETAFADGFSPTLDRLIEMAPAEPPVLVAPEDLTYGALLTEEDVQGWWLRHLLTTPTPLAERMTYFWHGHFTSDLNKAGGLFMHWQNLTWRRMALGKLPDLLRRVTADPAMLTYLDLTESDASDPAQKPNENYARELLELFTVGPGTYHEADVKAAAKALAGWTSPPPDEQVDAVVDANTGATQKVDIWRKQTGGQFDISKAYDGEVSFLGRSARFDLDGLIERVLAQPSAATFLARKVAVHFISPQPAAATVRELADAFRSSGYDTRTLLRAAFSSAEFGAQASFRSLVKSPVEFMADAAVALGAPVADAARLIIGYGEATGEQLFRPPNVAGWPRNGRWISSGAVLARFNYVGELLATFEPSPPFGDAVRLHLDGITSQSTAVRLNQASTDVQRWLTLLTSPEFNLK